MRSVFLLFLLFPLIGSAQSHNFRIYSIEEGVPQSQVHAIVQDKDGFLWFGTDGGGLLRFAGKKKTLYTTTEGLCNDLVYALAEDEKGRLWIGTAKGLSIFHKDVFVPVPAELKPLADLFIRCIIIDKVGRMHFATGKGAFIYDGKKLEKVAALEDKPLLVVYEAVQGEFFYGSSGNGLYHIDGSGKVRHYTAAEGLRSNNVTALINYKSELWVGTDNGICRLQGETFTHQSLPAPGTAKQIIRCFFADRSSSMWVGTADCGIYELHALGVTRYGKNEGLGIEGVFCITEDRESNLWIGTDGNGAARLGPRTFTSYGKQQGMPDEMILSLFRTSKGEWWYGNDNGVTHFDGKNYKKYNSGNGLTDEKVWSIIEDKEGKIWITTYGSGIFVFDGKRFTNYAGKDGLSSSNVRAVFQDSKGRIWAGTANGLFLFDGKRFSQIISPGLKATRFLCFYEDKQHRLWIGTSAAGLALLKESNGSFDFKMFSETEGMADNVVLSIDEDEHGHIWTGNFGGLSRVNPETGEIRKLTKKDGLASNTVYAIKFSTISLLAGTNNGVDKINLKEYNSTGKVVIRHFGKEDGFGGVECNTNSVFKDETGYVYFGTIKGVFVYNPFRDRVNSTPPLTHISNLRLFFEPFDHSLYSDSGKAGGFLPRHMTFPYDQNHLTFDFTGSSMTTPEKVKYRYMLDGLDKVYPPDISETSVTYSNLPPGEYTFRVNSSTNDNIWGMGTRFSFTITPPFWRTWWFITLSSAALVFAVYMIFRIRIRRMKRIQQMLKEQVALKTMELREEKEIVEKQHRQITSSIHYAKRIQDSILPLKEKLSQITPDSFIFFQPKDIVSGDFYWFSKRNGHTLVAAVDCTGHGVPGAFMSLIGNNLLNNIVNHQGISDPKEVLEKLHEGVVLALKKNERESETVDGMDIALCVLDEKTNVLQFASSGRPLLLVRGNEVKKFKNGKHPVGLVTRHKAVFEKEVIRLNKGDAFYILTDGYCDQFGGTEDDKFMEYNLEKLLLHVKGKSMQEQAEALEKSINEWKGKRPQLDDILIIGIRV